MAEGLSVGYPPRRARLAWHAPRTRRRG